MSENKIGKVDIDHVPTNNSMKDGKTFEVPVAPTWLEHMKELGKYARSTWAAFACTTVTILIGSDMMMIGSIIAERSVVATAGNFASPLSPHEQSAGPVFRLNIYHLVNIEDPAGPTLFLIKYYNLGTKSMVPDTCYAQKFFKPADFEGIKPEKVVAKSVPSTTANMRQLARVIRSKNSGPFKLTFDIMFDDPAVYERVKKADVLNVEVVKKLYQLKDDDILVNMFFDPALAWKCTIKRPWEQGPVGERDTLGTAHHAPLMDVMVPGVDQ